jgi:multisubunit Na+/H+ antiporter MnhG subunit
VGDAVVIVLLVAGTSAQLLAALGVAALRDVDDRLHCVGLAGFGALLIGVAILVHESFSLIGDKAVATGALLVVLGPIVVHVTARSLRIRALGDWRTGIEEHREDPP